MLVRDDIEPHAILGNHIQVTAAARAGLILDIDHHFGAGKMSRNWATWVRAQWRGATGFAALGTGPAARRTG